MKLVAINSCAYCPHRVSKHLHPNTFESRIVNSCTKTNRAIVSLNNIPEWCPLQDATAPAEYIEDPCISVFHMKYGISVEELEARVNSSQKLRDEYRLTQLLECYKNFETVTGRFESTICHRCKGSKLSTVSPSTTVCPYCDGTGYEA